MMGAPPSPRRAARGARTWCLAGLAAIATGCVATEHVEPRDPFEVLSTADVPDGTTVAAVDLEPTGAGTMTWEDVETGERFEVRTQAAPDAARAVRTDPADERTLSRAADFAGEAPIPAAVAGVDGAAAAGGGEACGRRGAVAVWAAARVASTGVAEGLDLLETLPSSAPVRTKRRRDDDDDGEYDDF
jgi:hypothetical protein